MDAVWDAFLESLGAERTFVNAALRKPVRRAPPSKLADAPEGVPVRVEGIVRALDPLLDALLSGKPCVHFTTYVDLRLHGTVIGQLPFARAVAGVRFALDDGSGLAIVDPAYARTSARFDYTVTRPPTVVDHRQRVLLATARFSRWDRVHTVRYREAIVEVGQRIVLHGAGTRDGAPTGDGGYRDTGTQLQFRGTRRYPLVVCDHPDRL